MFRESLAAFLIQRAKGILSPTSEKFSYIEGTTGGVKVRKPAGGLEIQ